MTSVTTKPVVSHPATEGLPHLFDDWIDPIETEVRERAREFIEALIREELETALARPRYGRQTKDAALEHERAKVELKALVPEDAKVASGHGVRAKRLKSGAVSFDLLDVEGSHATIQ